MSNHDVRRDRLRRSLKQRDIKAMLITHEPNVTYLTGFTGDSSALLVTPTADLLISDTRFTVQIAEECPGLEADIRTQALTHPQQLTEVLSRCDATEIGIEANRMSVAVHETLTKGLRGKSLISIVSVVEHLRAIKDKDEVAAIRTAIAVAEKTIRVISAGLSADQTERQVAANLEHEIRRLGGEGCSFPPIVGVGPRAALPHAPATETRIGESPFVLIDWGARVGGYVSDLTRVFVTGKIPPKLQRIYGVVLNAQMKAIQAIRPGALLADVDKTARRVIARAGFERHFEHGLGHGIGLEVHEYPRLSANQTGALAAGMVVTVEPGIYLPGWGGVRIEDDVLVTRDGCEVLSSIPKDLESCCISM